METVYIHAVIGICRLPISVQNPVACGYKVFLLLMDQKMLVCITGWQVTRFIFTIQNTAGLGNYGIISDASFLKVL